MKKLSSLLFLLFALQSSYAQNIMDCKLQAGSNTENLFVYITDTIGVHSFHIKIGSFFDGSDLLNEEYVIGSLPGNATLVENTFSVSLDEISGSPKYVWVTLLLSDYGSKEIKVTAD